MSRRSEPHLDARILSPTAPPQLLWVRVCAYQVVSAAGIKTHPKWLREQGWEPKGHLLSFPHRARSALRPAPQPRSHLLARPLARGGRARAPAWGRRPRPPGLAPGAGAREPPLPPLRCRERRAAAPPRAAARDPGYRGRRGRGSGRVGEGPFAGGGAQAAPPAAAPPARRLPRGKQGLL